jgi:putative glutamine amidotransferase
MVHPVATCSLRLLVWRYRLEETAGFGQGVSRPRADDDRAIGLVVAEQGGARLAAQNGCRPGWRWTIPASAWEQHPRRGTRAGFVVLVVDCIARMRPRIGISSTPTVHDERRVDRVSRWYVDAVLRAGGLPLILPTLSPADAEEVVAGLDGLVLTGGGDVSSWLYGEDPAPEAYDVDPARDAWERALAAAAAAAQDSNGHQNHERLPVLGVCRGAQLLNVVAGGSLIQHLPNVTEEAHRQREHYSEPVHDVAIDPTSRLAAILGQGRLGVNTIHHQAISRVGEGYRPVAWAADGIIEAIEATDGAPVVAVQWHPEFLIDLPPHGQLFLWLTRAAAAQRPELQMPESFREAAPVDAGLGHLVDDVA